MSGNSLRLPTPRRLLAFSVGCTIALGAIPGSAFAGPGNGNGNGNANARGQCDPMVSVCETGRKNG